MKRIVILIVASLFVFTNANAQESKKSCSHSKSKSAQKSCSKSKAAYIKNVNAVDFQNFIDQFPAEQIVDVRTAREFKAGNILNAQNIDIYDKENFIKEVSKLDKDAAVMLYCRSGRRSADAAKILKEIGFRKIYNLEGGFLSYQKTFTKR